MKKLLLLTFVIFGFVLNGYSQIPSYIPKDSLIGWWPFNGNNKNLITLDTCSINGTNVKLNKDRFGKDNSAYSFSGDGFIQASKLKLTSGERSISFWVKLNNTTDRHMLISYGKCCNRATLIGYNICGSGTFYVTGGVANHSADMRSIDPLQWNHFVVVFSKAFTKFYINGKYVSSTSETVFENTSDTSLNKIIFGSGIDGLGNAPYRDDCTSLTNGFLDDIAIWNRVLDSNEINVIYEVKNCNLIITKEPTDKGCFNGNLDFSIATNDSTAQFQWQTNQGIGWVSLNNAGQYNGVTTDSLVVKNITTSNDGQLFRCIAIGNCGKDTTREAKLSVWGVNTNQIHKPRFTLHPNPVAQQIQIAGLNEREFKYEIYSIAGRLISKGVSSGTINVSEMSSGIYLLGINGQNVKFIKE